MVIKPANRRSSPTKSEHALCISCKTRKIACRHDGVPGVACQGCQTKGLDCSLIHNTSFSPPARRSVKERSGKRIEEARARFGTVTTIFQSHLLVKQPEPVDPLDAFDLPFEMAKHLYNVFDEISKTWLPLQMPLQLCNAFISNSGATSMSTLGIPVTSVALLWAIFSLSCRVSSHEAFFTGADLPPPPFVPAAGQPPLIPRVGQARLNIDLRMYGRARKELANTIQAKATSFASKIHAATTQTPTTETMYTCLLLSMSEEASGRPKSARLLGDAFVNQLRLLTEREEWESWNSPQPVDSVVKMPLAWLVVVVKDTLRACHSGRLPRFSRAEYPLYLSASLGAPHVFSVTVELPDALQQLVAESAALDSGLGLVDIRDATQLFFRPMKICELDSSQEQAQAMTAFDAVCLHILHIAHDCSDRALSYARTRPFDADFFQEFSASLPHLRGILRILSLRSDMLLSPQAMAARNVPPLQEVERQFSTRACLFTSTMCFASIILPMWRELSRRHANALEGDPVSSVVNGSSTVLHPSSSILSDLHAQLAPWGLQAVRILAHALSPDLIPSLGRLCCFQNFETVELGCEVLMEWPVSEEAAWDPAAAASSPWIGEEDSSRWGKLGRREKAFCLESLMAALKLRGWAWEEPRDRWGRSLTDRMELALAQLEESDGDTTPESPAEFLSFLNI